MPKKTKRSSDVIVVSMTINKKLLTLALAKENLRRAMTENEEQLTASSFVDYLASDYYTYLLNKDDTSFQDRIQQTVNSKTIKGSEPTIKLSF